ncbi:phosphotransferase [Candidatus Falkowbacteria bacterium]|nr:phosphotransferase [Candidatus Falkowbacteria bacterium]
MIKRSIPKIKLAKSDFIKILSGYDLGAFKHASYFTLGWLQTTVLLTTTKGKFVLRVYVNRSARHVWYEAKLLNYLKNKKFPVAAPIKSILGRLVGQYQSKPYLIIEYIDAHPTKNPNSAVQPRHLTEVIRVIAHLHTLTKGYAPAYVRYHQRFDRQYCWREYKKNTHGTRSATRDAWLKYELAALELPTGLPKGICHADLNYSNFLFKQGTIAAVLDFDMSFYTDFIYDIANIIFWWAWPPHKGLNVRRAKRIIAIYSRYRPLSDQERRHIYDALKLIILIGVGWCAEDEFDQERKKVEYLNAVGRNVF